MWKAVLMAAAFALTLQAGEVMAKKGSDDGFNDHRGRGRGEWESGDDHGRGRGGRGRGGRHNVARTTGEHSYADVLKALHAEGYAHPSRVEYDQGSYRVEGMDEAGRPFLVNCDPRTCAIERIK